MTPTLHLVSDAQKIDYSRNIIALHEERDRLLKILFAECGFPDLPIYYRLIEEMLCYGMEPDLIEMLIESTAEAPRPSYAYFRACFMNCRNAGIKTAEAHMRYGKKGFEIDKDTAMSIYNAKFGEYR